jgi:hypothetical protein
MTQASTERVHILLAAGALDSESLVTGQFLDGADLSEKSLVIFGAGGDRITTSETRLEAGKRYIIAADPDVADAILSTFRGESLPRSLCPVDTRRRRHGDTAGVCLAARVLEPDWSVTS